MNRAFRTFLLASGIYLILALPFSVYRWPTVFRWHPYSPKYDHMLIVIYMIIGVFLLLSSFDVRRHLSLLWFSAWVNIVHGGMMAIDAFMDPVERSHLTGDVALTLAMGLVIGLFLIGTRHSSAVGQGK
jgi:hypothetical protein